MTNSIDDITRGRVLLLGGLALCLLNIINFMIHFGDIIWAVGSIINFSLGAFCMFVGVSILRGRW